MSISYTSIPQSAAFQADSSVTFAVRKDDIILKKLDALLERYHSSERPQAVGPALLCDLFLTCNFWIKSFKEGNSRLLKERFSAVLALFEVVVKALCDVFHCTQGQLSAVVAETYGRNMDEHGYKVDYEDKRARYMSPVERETYRLRFKCGLAYQLAWWRKGGPDRLVLAESEHAFDGIRRSGHDQSRDFGAFIMSVERELYMFKPDVAAVDSRAGIFHSSLTGGSIVTMAGTMLIKQGKIRGIRGDSGHYKPTPVNMALLLQGLAMYQIDLRPIVIYDFAGKELGSGPEFLRPRMDFYELRNQRLDELAHRKKAHDYMAPPQLPVAAHSPDLPYIRSVNGI